MSLRHEFVLLARQEDANISALCRQFGISRKTGYKWLARYETDGTTGLTDQSRRPHASPRQTPAVMEQQILDLRAEHPAWGSRKLHHRLRTLGVQGVPSPSTITAILRRHGQLDPDRRTTRDLTRFEHPYPNALWQLDFMGHQPLAQGRVHPLSLLDDHSRFALDLGACPNEQQLTVQTRLIAVFQHYGLPETILTDNGPPWGTSGMGGHTALEVWLIRLGIRVIHGRAYHPQTQGKVERWHRTIQAEIGDTSRFPDLHQCQHAFDTWRACYNLERPHAVLDHAVPASCYQPSPRPYPADLPPITYGPDDQVRLVNTQGVVSLHHRRHFISRGLAGLPVAVRPTTDDGVFTVFFCHQQVGTISLRTSEV